MILSTSGPNLHWKGHLNVIEDNPTIDIEAKQTSTSKLLARHKTTNSKRTQTGSDNIISKMKYTKLLPWNDTECN